jgi:hypothetical protein
MPTPHQAAPNTWFITFSKTGTLAKTLHPFEIMLRRKKNMHLILGSNITMLFRGGAI